MEIDTKQRKKISLKLAQQGLEINDLDLYNEYRKIHLIKDFGWSIILILEGIIIGLIIALL